MLLNKPQILELSKLNEHQFVYVCIVCVYVIYVVIQVYIHVYLIVYSQVPNTRGS